MMIKDFLKNNASTPNRIARMPKVISKGRVAMPDLILYKAILFKIKERMTPIHAPNPKVPSLGK